MITALLVFLPFGLGIADYIIGKKSENGRNVFAVISTFVELILSILLVFMVLRGNADRAALDIPDSLIRKAAEVIRSACIP